MQRHTGSDSYVDDGFSGFLSSMSDPWSSPPQSGSTIDAPAFSASVGSNVAFSPSGIGEAFRVEDVDDVADDGSSDEEGVASPGASYTTDANDGSNGDRAAPARQNLSAIRMTTQGVAKVLGEDKMNRAERMKISREDRIIARRGAFLWLPVMFCNDMVHGSWWFVWGSLVAMVTSVFPLIQIYYPLFYEPPSTLPILSYVETWSLLVISGFFFTIGSYAFVRAFTEPPLPPLFTWKHLATDELLGAWLFFWAAVPALPYSFVYWSLDPGNIIYLGMLLMSAMFVLASYLFVLGCYPSDTAKKYKNCLKPTARVIFGRNHWVMKHLQNDWLAGTWVFFWGTLICVFGSFGIFWESLATDNELEQFIYALGLADFIMFLIGCMYFVAGSYPLDMLRVYRPGKGKKGKNAGHGHGHHAAMQTSAPGHGGGHHFDDRGMEIVELRDDSDEESGKPPSRMKQFLTAAELFLHPKTLRSHYEVETTENIGDAENPLHAMGAH